MVHALLRYAKAIDKTHKGLGRLVSFCLLNMKARKFLLIVSVAGTGKSTAMKKALEANLDGTFSIQEFTRSGLGIREKELTGFKGCVMLEDLGNVDTIYSLKESVKSSIMLCYEHQLSKLNASTNVNIHDYNGSIITSIQPSKMQAVVSGTDWEAVIRDKTTRYYHLWRPLKPNRQPIKVKLSWGKPIESIRLGKRKKKLYEPLEEIGLIQWGRSRVNEHIDDFLRASAALDNRTSVNSTDYKVVKELMRPMILENQILEKEGFESEKKFMGDAMCMLTELASYKTVHHKDIATDFGVSIRTVERLLSTVRMLYTPDPKDLKISYPSQEAKELLQEAGFW